MDLSLLKEILFLLSHFVELFTQLYNDLLELLRLTVPVGLLHLLQFAEIQAGQCGLLWCSYLKVERWQHSLWLTEQTVKVCDCLFGSFDRERQIFIVLWERGPDCLTKVLQIVSQIVLIDELCLQLNI